MVQGHEGREPAWVGQVLGYWFDTLTPDHWFGRDAEVDGEISRRFGALHAAVARSPPEELLDDGRTALAAVVVLDQFPRNMFRGTAEAFATDAAALGLAQAAIARGLDRELTDAERQFLYMPFQHSEDAATQAQSVALFESLGDATGYDFALRHKAIIDRFGRFPHRNAILGRASTAVEIAFLQQPGSSF